MNKKIAMVVLLAVIMVVSITFINKEEKRDGVYFEDKEYTKEISPISKDTVLNIIRAEYGDIVDVDKKDIKVDGDKYKVELFVTVYDEDKKNEESIGVHEIDMYTGDIKLSSSE